MANVIEAKGLGKSYRLGVDGSYDTLRGAIRNAFSRQDSDEIWALRDVSFTVEQGEALGIIGANGAGKTTLLRVLAGITEPSAGEARTRGRVGALLEVGTGFHPELTGRENVYLNGAILGMSREQVRRRFDEIVEFAGVERFLETPVKRYSEGMRLRLAFAVAAHIEPPILVVDEVLAWGDAAFREKCLRKMAEIGTHDRTVLFVSHDLGTLTRLCPRAIWLDEGGVREDGPSQAVVASYLQSGVGAPLVADIESGERPVVLRSVAIRSPTGDVLSAVKRDQRFAVDLLVDVREPVPGLDVAIGLLNEEGVRVIAENKSDRDEDWGPGVGTCRLSAMVPAVLKPGRYSLEVWIGSTYEDYVHREVLSFDVRPLESDHRELIERRRVVQPTVEWQVRREAAEYLAGGQ